MRRKTWLLGTLLGILGVLVAAPEGAPSGQVFLVTGGLLLTGLALFERSRPPWPILILSAASVIVVVTASSLSMGPWAGQPERFVPVNALGIQGLLLALRKAKARLDTGLERYYVPALGHLLCLYAGGLIVLSPGLNGHGILAYAAGFTVLFVDSLWMRRQSRSEGLVMAGWEGVFLLTMSVTVTLVAVLTADPVRTEVPTPSLRAAGGLTRLSVILGLSLLARPPPLPSRWQARPGGVWEFLVNAISFAALLNIIVLVFFITARFTVVPAYLVLTTWLVVAVLFEYATVIYAAARSRNRDDGPAWEGPLPGLTAIVVARNDAGPLRHSLPVNLGLPDEVRFLLVPSASSSDDTMLLCQRWARSLPDRVTVLPGPGGSKAADLTLAWTRVRTEWALILDADETLDEASLRIALGRTGEDVGVVQGRKVPRDAESTRLRRFIAVERRFSTLLDHPMQAGLFGASHFAGSGALVRRDLPKEVGPWNASTLTEDIEFTMRVHEDGRYRIVYEPRMRVREDLPTSLPALTRQRGRWARGWGQVYGLHLGRLIRNAARIGPKRTLGLFWQLVTSVSAPWSVFLPALTLLWLRAGSPVLPGVVAITLAVLIIPSRFLSYPFAYFAETDPEPRRGVLRFLEVLLYSYLWVPFGWFLQLHALYQEMSRMPRHWHATRQAARP